MMKSLILCEGKTDAILLSYYLGKVKGWVVDKRPQNRTFSVPVRNPQNESAYWYRAGDQNLLIWGVGGKDNFGYALEKILDINHKLAQGEGFSKLVILRDRDQEVNDEIICEQLQQYLGRSNSEISLRNNHWTSCIYHDGFGDMASLRILPIIIPFEQKGAIETFLLDALSKRDAEDEQMVKQCRTFVQNFKSSRYLQTTCQFRWERLLHVGRWN